MFTGVCLGIALTVACVYIGTDFCTSQGDYGSVIDYWPFVKGLKWLNPVMTPFIEKIRKGQHQKGVSKGQVWVRESLQEHKLSMQLKVLVSSEQHMYRHYFGK